MKKNSKVIILERNRFAMLVKMHRKSLLIIDVLTYICRVRNVNLVMTIEEACQVLRLDPELVKKQRSDGMLRYIDEEGIHLYEIADLVRLKNAQEMIAIYRRINAASVSVSSRK